ISPDIIHFHNFLGLSLAIVETARKQSIPYIFTPHNYWTLCPRLYLLNKEGAQCSGPSSDGKKCAQCVDNSDEYSHYSSRLSHAISLFSDSGNRIIPPSHRTKQLLVEHGFTHDTITVIHQASPITEQLWHSVGKVRKNSNTSEKLSILYCGALMPIKGVHILVHAVQYLSPDAISVNIYGGGSQEYIRYLQSLDTNHILHFHGKYSLNDLPNILKQADIMVAPSLCEETGGLILTEALAARVPVIASAIGGYTDFIHNDSNGYLFTPGSAQELYNILQLLVSDQSKLHSLLQKMGAPRLFSDYINDITVLYSQLIQSHNNERKSSYTNIG
ncbi:MAG TPA: glycosyltransferase, partial [Candidatus Kapabacteria bacterium]|nr:glycosyltransferase [Candidatus Kapabacteria bacterium]